MAFVLILNSALAVPAFAASTQQVQTPQTNQIPPGQTQQSGQSLQQPGSTVAETIGTAAKYLIDQGIMKGNGNGNYNLQGNLKRGDLMIMIVNAFHLTSDVSGTAFRDVSSGSYYYSAIDTTKDLGIALGDGTNFKPESPVTIQEAILFIQRAAAKAGITLASDFTSSYDSKALMRNATRNDVADLLYKVLAGSTTSTSSTASDTISTAANITCTTDENEAVTLDASDFSDAFNTATGETLSYVTFTPPSSTYGKLYYDYTSSSSYDSKVTASTKYYASASPYLSDVTFAPTEDYSGTVSIAYTGYASDGTACTGILKVTVSADDSSTAANITCTTDENEAVTLDDSDFSDAFEAATDETLSYVKFTLPSSTYGKLYYDYTSSSSYDSKVTASKKYYASESPYLSDVSFVPADDYSGTVSVAYTGYSTDGTVCTGILKITVSADDSTAENITYSTDQNEAITLDDSDFSDAFEAATDETLSYVKFTLPSSTYGKLYYDYTSDSEYDSKVSASTKYHVSDSPYLSSVTFVPAEDYTGTVSVYYTGYSSDGATCTGIVKITVNED